MENQGDYNYTKPKHYLNNGKEVIDMMVDIWGKDKVRAFCEMNAFKYRMRIGLKPDEPIDREIEKAIWYEKKVVELKSDNVVKPNVFMIGDTVKVLMVDENHEEYVNALNEFLEGTYTIQQISCDDTVLLGNRHGEWWFPIEWLEKLEK